MKDHTRSGRLTIKRLFPLLSIAFWIGGGLYSLVTTGPALAEGQKTPEAYQFAKLKPLGLDEVTITDGYWRPRIEHSRETGVFDYLAKFEEHGSIENFRIVSEQRSAAHSGWANNNEFVHKLLEAAGYYAGSSPRVQSTFLELADTILAAQDKDGYLNTFYDNPIVKQRGLKKRFQESGRFEFYNFGHFAQAAVAWHKTTGDDRLLQGALRFANLIVQRFGYPNRLPYRPNSNRPNLKYEHPNHETAMVDLYRETGDVRYLEFAKYTLDQYGFWNFPEIFGHAVQENLLMTGGADVYLEYGKPEMLDTLLRLWTDMRQRKMYVTGGIGSSDFGESYGKAYDLPNDTAYAETCAAIAGVFFNFRMLLATGESRFADTIERALYNGVMVGLSLSGTEYFYRNVLSYDPANPRENREARRLPYFDTSCCPPNVHRLLGSLQQYIYTQNEKGLQVHLYIGSKLNKEISEGNRLLLTQQTDYPWTGTSTLVIEPQRSVEFTLQLRIPEWTQSRISEGDLYQFLQIEGAPAPQPAARIFVNDEEVSWENEGGFASLRKQWKSGDRVRIEFAMPPRRVVADERVEADRNRTAIQRGPLIYCAEGVDYSTPVGGLFLPDDSPLQAEFRPDLLGGVTVVRGLAHYRAEGGEERSERLFMIPYHLWANRAPAGMVVWLNRGTAGRN